MMSKAQLQIGIIIIRFHNNSSMEGGDHIYGALMHSGDCYVDPAHKVVASCCVQKYFHYNPKSQSSVSPDPMRVCVCKNGGQQCDESYSHINITFHPGETFTLSVVIVGADFGIPHLVVFMQFLKILELLCSLNHPTNTYRGY